MLVNEYKTEFQFKRSSKNSKFKQCLCLRTVVAKGDAREVGDRELELFQICQSTSLPGLSVIFFR